MLRMNSQEGMDSDYDFVIFPLIDTSDQKHAIYEADKICKTLMARQDEILIDLEAKFGYEDDPPEERVEEFAQRLKEVGKQLSAALGIRSKARMAFATMIQRNTEICAENISTLIGMSQFKG